MVARIQNNGIARVTSLLAAASWHLQWGTGSGAAASANVVTTTSTTEARVAATTSQQTNGSPSNNVFRMVAAIVAAGARAITEIGAFDAAGSGSPPTGGNMNFYADFSAVNLASTEQITFTIDVQLS